ncbi:cell division protein SepF [Synechococcus sp. J7-Johnson]|jgi:cell division inhibitor SepF|uniref:cell division protein SepF n=1 Tax=Synechococcus sp. J7-Johnson TaxID=2823737 RepID=UPI0037D9C1BD|nr:cell division protein SepF [Synechococcus sp. J7-Johnson]
MDRFSDLAPEVVLMEPRRFEDVLQAVQAVRERKTVVLNFGSMPPEEAQRSADFVSGGVFALDGHQERLGEMVFLFAPFGVDVSRDPGSSAEP